MGKNIDIHYLCAHTCVCMNTTADKCVEGTIFSAECRF